MVEIIQTQINKSKIAFINAKIHSLSQRIKNLEKQKENLDVTYFCGKEILYEKEKDYDNEYKKGYTLAIIMCSGKSDFKMHARVWRDMGDLSKETYCAEVEEYSVNWHYPDWYNKDGHKHQHGIKSFEEAKELSRTWLAELIEKHGSEK